MSRKSDNEPEHGHTPFRRLVVRLRAAQIGAIALRSAVFGSVAIVLSGFGHALLHPVRDEGLEAAGVVAAIVSEEPSAAILPASVVDHLGYEPSANDGRLQNPTGACSTPLPIGPDAFEDACRIHDLGYDVLRVAEESGGRLGAWARFELDRRLYADLLARCHTVRCRTVATAYYTAVTTNSIRQGYKAPTDEPTTPWVGLGLLVIGLAVITEPRGALRTMAREVTGPGWNAAPKSPRFGRLQPIGFRSARRHGRGRPSALPWGMIGESDTSRHRGRLRSTV